MGAKKNFVIDTNVILHDYNCLKNFQENDIYLPIVVLDWRSLTISFCKKRNWSAK